MFDADLFTVLMARSNMYSCQQTDALLEKKADLDENGMVPVNELPTSIFERMIVVENDTARFALTTSEVQNGDVVYVNDTMIMYFVIDDTKLDQEAGYREFAAGIAAKAIGDKNGNDITTTYQTKIDANNKLPADNVVLTGYAVDDSRSNITASSSVRDAVEQLEYREELNKNNILSEQGKTTGMTEGGSNYITVGGIRVYVSATAPTGARTGDLWIGG